MTSRTLTYNEVRSFYDRVGIWYESQDFYERPAINSLCRHASFGSARSVVELGCGTGKFALRLLTEELEREAHYIGLDVSGKMVSLARERTAPFVNSRVEIRQTDGNVRALPIPDESCDRFVACYVLDILSLDDIHAVLEEARRILRPNGLLCIAGLTHGIGTISRFISRAWACIHRLDPRLVGGCRPVEVRTILDAESWTVTYSRTVTSFGVPSEVVVARRRHR